jgi:methyl-accepting chemotaxis protein
MEEVVDSVKRVTDIMSDIAAASAEQSAGIEQINLSIIEMDGMTQQNAALVEQAAASFQSLQNQAAELQRVVSIFKVEPGEEAVAAAPAPAPASTSTAVATRAVVARPARPSAAAPQAAPPQPKKPAPAPARKARPAAAKMNEEQAPASASPSSTSKKVAAAAASDDWEEF